MLSDKLGNCQMCESEPAKYTCPGCEMRTCCLDCVKNHKTEMDCDGKRNKTAYKPLSKFTNLDFLSDYTLLEDISQAVDCFAKDKRNHYARSQGDLPKHLFKLRQAAHHREMRLWFLPPHFSRSKQNTTYIDWRTWVISWKVQWMFSNAKNEKIQVVDKLVCENCILQECVASKIESNDDLSLYKEAGIELVSVLLRAENIPNASKSYFHLDLAKSLKENLRGHTLVEYPVLHVVLSKDLTQYDIITLEEAKKRLKSQTAPWDRKTNEIPSTCISETTPSNCKTNASKLVCEVDDEPPHKKARFDSSLVSASNTTTLVKTDSSLLLSDISKDVSASSSGESTSAEESSSEEEESSEESDSNETDNKTSDTIVFKKTETECDMVISAVKRFDTPAPISTLDK